MHVLHDYMHSGPHCVFSPRRVKDHIWELLLEPLYLHNNSLTDTQHILVGFCCDEALLQGCVRPLLHVPPPVYNKEHAICTVFDNISW